jgi:hypothetical protein
MQHQVFIVLSYYSHLPWLGVIQQTTTPSQSMVNKQGCLPTVAPMFSTQLIRTATNDLPVTKRWLAWKETVEKMVPSGKSDWLRKLTPEVQHPILQVNEL